MMNQRILVSRNKREGYYAGTVGRMDESCTFEIRTHYRNARIYSLRGPKREKVNFADLGIKLHTIEEAINGNP